jgi:hypothetical protein
VAGQAKVFYEATGNCCIDCSRSTPAAAAAVSSIMSRRQQQQHRRSPSVQLLHLPSTSPCFGGHGAVELLLAQVNLPSRPATGVSLKLLLMQTMRHLPLMHL